MEKSWSSELLEEFDEVLDAIKNMDSYQEYLELDAKISKNDRVLSLIEEVKACQKELVQVEHSSDSSIPLLTKYQKLLEELEDIPLYNSYKESQKEVNKYLQEIKFEIEKVLDSTLK